ncbi:hypothetical protein V8E36_000567 [Tilletia maclaganii]
MAASLRPTARSYGELIRLALPGRLGRIYTFSFLALHFTLSTVLTVPVTTPNKLFWTVLRPFWPQLIACSLVAFVLGLLPLLIADRRATSRMASSKGGDGAASALSSSGWLTLLLLRVNYALVLSITYAVALSLANDATSPTYRDSWALYLPAYYGRNAGTSGGHSGTVTSTTSRRHGGHPSGSSSHHHHSHTQSRPNERFIFLVLSALLTSAIIPVMLSRTSVQGALRRPGDATAMLFHPLALEEPLQTRLRTLAWPQLSLSEAEAEPGKEPARLFGLHTLLALLLPPAVYLPIYAVIRRPLYRSLLMFIMRLTSVDSRSGAQLLSGPSRASSLSASAASNLRYYLIPSLRGGTLSFLFNVELFLRPALLSAAIFAIAEISLSLARVYASQPVLVSGFADVQGNTSQSQPSPSAAKDAFTAPTRCLVDGVVSTSTRYLRTPATSGKDLYLLHLAVAELAIIASSSDPARRKALFNDFGSTNSSGRSSLSFDSLGQYNAGNLQTERESAWAQVAKAGCNILREEANSIRKRSAPPASTSSVLVSRSVHKTAGSADKDARPRFGKDAFVPFAPPSAPGASGGAPSVYKTPPAPKTIWDKLADEVAATGSPSAKAAGASAPAANKTGPSATASALFTQPASAAAKAPGLLPKVSAVAGTALRLLLPPSATPAAPPQSSQSSSSTAVVQGSFSQGAAAAPLRPLDALQSVLHAVQQNGQAAAQQLDQLVPPSSREAILKKVHGLMPGYSGDNDSSITGAFLTLLLPISPSGLQRFSPLLQAEASAAATSARLARVLPPHPALGVWTAQALANLAAASLGEDEYGCVQRASRASARARARSRRGGEAGVAAAAAEGGAGVSDLLEAMLELWEAVDSAVRTQRTKLTKDGRKDAALLSAWEVSVHNIVLVPLCRSIGELWAAFGRFGAEVGFGAEEEQGAEGSVWRGRIEAVLRDGE